MTERSATGSGYTLDMKTAKQEVRDLLDRLPADVSMDTLLYELEFLAAIRRGLEDVENGRVVSQEEVEERVRGWRESSGQQRLSKP